MATVTVKQDDIEPPRDVRVIDRHGDAWWFDRYGWRFDYFMKPTPWSEVRRFYGDDFPMSYGENVDLLVADVSTGNTYTTFTIDSVNPLSTFVVKDSGTREEYTNGFVRDSEENKHDFTRLLSIEGLEFVPVELVERMAAHMSKGAVKYGKENWRQARGAIAKARFLRSACRHFLQWVRGDRDEDHGMAVCFNIIAYELTEENDE